jgi:uncharacterized membrane protein YfcA
VTELLGGSVAAAILMAVAAVLIGFSKTAIGGLGVLAVAVFATVLPPRQSTAAILAVLIVGDVIACWHYRRDPDWALIRRLLPAVLPGLVLGTVFLALVDDTTLRRSLGALLLVLLLLQLWVKTQRPGRDAGGRQSLRAWGAGTGMGFTTMTANAAGPVMTIYLSAVGIDKRGFVGTSAWFFLIVNVVKLPFSAGLGLLHTDDVARAALLAPAVLAGGLLGYAMVARISQRSFDVSVLLASAVAAAALLLG